MKTKRPLMEAKAIANTYVAMLAPFCNRIEIAGSIRREKSEVGDIEIVCEPIMRDIHDMFGVATERISLVDSFFAGTSYNVGKNGMRYKQIELPEGITLDLFMVIPPAQWGVIFTIRTGPSEFSRKLVTARKFGGLMPSNMQVKDGALWHHGEMLETPDEADFFRLIGVEYLEPSKRS